MPFGDQTSSLRVKPGTSLLIASRVTTVDGRPAVLEETRTPADQTEFAYSVPVARGKRRS